MHGRKKPSPTPTSPALPAWLTVHADGVTLALKVQPRASKTEITTTDGPELRVRVTAPPVDAAANEALIRFLAEVIDCPRRQVELLRGQTSQHKTVKVHRLHAAIVAAKILAQT